MRKNMKLKLIIMSIALSIMFLTLPAFSNSVQFVNQVADKQEVTFGDVVKFFVFVTEGRSVSFEADLAILTQKNITQGINLKENDVINLGTLSLMCARALNLKNTLLYNVFKNRRYAVRACIAAGIIPDNSGGYDKVSGEALIQVMRRVEKGE